MILVSLLGPFLVGKRQIYLGAGSTTIGSITQISGHSTTSHVRCQCEWLCLLFTIYFLKTESTSVLSLWIFRPLSFPSLSIHQMILILDWSLMIFFSLMISIKNLFLEIVFGLILRSQTQRGIQQQQFIKERTFMKMMTKWYTVHGFP